eukprot:1352124-Heterocapsa_arctica.AAC.1
MEAKNAEYFASKLGDAMVDQALKGAPHHHVWGAMIVTLLAQEFPKPVADQHFALLRQHSTTISGPQDLEEYVNI